MFDPFNMFDPFGAGRRRINPASFFLPGDVGFAYDPSNLASMFQDVAGTVPANQPGHPVGLRLDTKHGLGLGPELVTNGDNEAALSAAPGSALTGFVSREQSADRARSGTYSAKLTASALSSTHYWALWTVPANVAVQVTGSVYVPAGATAGQNIKIVDTSDGSVIQEIVAASAVDQWVDFRFFRAGKATAWSMALGQNVVANWSGGVIYIDNLSIRELPGIHATQSVAASRPTLARRPASGVRNLLTNTDAMGAQSVAVAAVAHTLSFTGAGTVTLSGASSAGPLVGTGAGNRVSLTFTPTAGNLTLTVTGSVTLAQLELGVAATAYQRVGSVYDVTEAGQPDRWCLVTDGVDDGMVTPTITPAVGADKVQVVAGVRKSTSHTGLVVEYSAEANTNAGTFYMFSNLGNYLAKSRGSLTAGTATVAAPVVDVAVITMTGDIAADGLSIARNGGVPGTSPVDQGTGQFGTYPAYLYRRGGTTQPGKIEDCGMICRISTTNLTAAQIVQLEAWANQRTGAY